MQQQEKEKQTAKVVAVEGESIVVDLNEYLEEVMLMRLAMRIIYFEVQGVSVMKKLITTICQ